MLTIAAFQQGNLLVCTCNMEHLTRKSFVYVPNSCGLVKIVKKKYCQISRTQEQIKPDMENLSRETCSSYRRVSELVKQGKFARLYGANRYVYLLVHYFAF